MASQGVVVICAAAALAACGTSSSGQSRSYEYSTTEPVRQAPLDIPPDLSTLPREGRFSIPTAASAATATNTTTTAPPGVNVATGATAPVAVGPAQSAVAPRFPNARIERAGTQRWLAVDVAPEAAYAVVKAFWPSIGLVLERDDPAAGVIETVWAENRAKLPQDLFRRTVGRVFDGLYATGEQEKYRTRIERTSTNTTEIYLTQRKMVETFVGTTQKEDRTVWVPKAPDTDLEAELLQRIALQFVPASLLPVAKVEPASVAGTSVAEVAPPPVVPSTQRRSSKLNPASGGEPGRVEVSEPFDRAWRKVGLALDRGGFTVEDRDRAKGVYFVRYLDPEYDAKVRASQGWISRVFGSDPKIEAQQFRIVVAAAGDAGTFVTVQDRDGKSDAGSTANRILQQVDEQLR